MREVLIMTLHDSPSPLHPPYLEEALNAVTTDSF